MAEPAHGPMYLRKVEGRFGGAPANPLLEAGKIVAVC